MPALPWLTPPSTSVYTMAAAGAWSWLNTPMWCAWAATAAAHSLADHPLRRLSGGRVCGAVQVVPAPVGARDAGLAAALWEESGRVTGLTHDVAALTPRQVGEGE